METGTVHLQVRWMVGELSDYLGQEFKWNIQSGYWLDMIKSGASSAAETVSGQMQTPFTEPVEAAGYSVGFRGGMSQGSDLSSALAHSGASARAPRQQHAGWSRFSVSQGGVVRTVGHFKEPSIVLGT